MERSKLIAPEKYNITEEFEKFTNRERVAVKCLTEEGEVSEISYAELIAKANQFANVLIKQGLEKGERVLILLPRSIDAYITYFACLKAGLVVIPCSEMLRAKDLTYRINHGEAKAVVSSHLFVAEVNNINEPIPTLVHKFVIGDDVEGWLRLEKLASSESEMCNCAATTRDEMAFLSYTSGTTGNPKGVVHTHGWGFAHIEVASKMWLDVKEGDVVWATAGPGWQKWLWSPFLSTLGLGSTALVYQGKFDPNKYLEILKDNEVTVMCCTPTEYRLMAKVDNIGEYSLPKLRSSVSAGEPLNREVIDTFKRQFNVDVRDGYGQTENTLLVGTLQGMEIKAGSMGKPTPGNDVVIINIEGNPVAVGEVGDIAVQKDAPALFKKYYKDEERTKMSYRGDFYVTGDQAKMDEDGYFWFEGRNDDIIISSGYTIGPFEVEDALTKHPAVKECAVVASPDEVRGNVVKAIIVLRNPDIASDALIKELQDHVKNLTAPYKYPRKVEFVSDLPKTISGKIRRVELRKKELESKK